MNGPERPNNAPVFTDDRKDGVRTENDKNVPQCPKVCFCSTKAILSRMCFPRVIGMMYWPQDKLAESFT